MKKIFIFLLLASTSFSVHSDEKKNLGLAIREFNDGKKGALAPCPTTPNCVTSYQHPGSDESHYMQPLQGRSPSESLSRIKFILLNEGAEIEKETQNYLHATFTSTIFRFVDDVEFYFPSSNNIHFRSASRVGYSDLGVNKRRIERIKFQFVQNQ